MEEKLRLLMAENDMLAERAEDSLLLGLISEKVALCEDAELLDGIALEQATVLKDLAAGLCLELRPEGAAIVDAFILYSSVDIRGTSLETGGELSAALEGGEALRAADCAADGFFRALGRTLPARVDAWLALAAGRRNGHECVYLFADEEGNPRLGVVGSMLRRVIDLVIARRENLELVEKLRSLNASLDGLVESRTAELQAANATLQGEIAERQRAEEKLRASLNEKTVLLKEVHHRVKNNLQIVSSLLNLQANEIDDGLLREKFSESQDRVHAMALVHERLYLSEDMSAIDFGEYLSELSDRLQQVYARPGVATVVEAGSIHLSLEQSIPCGLLANELISNAYKHAFIGRDRGALLISLACEGEDTIALEVKDDGVGLPDAGSLAKRNSIGLTLVYMLADQLGGAVRNDDGPGCRFIVRFPRRKSGAFCA
jgi:two-component sensor histidine kinase